MISCDVAPQWIYCACSGASIALRKAATSAGTGTPSQVPARHSPPSRAQIRWGRSAPRATRG
ncbi:hypothetical protein EIO_3171 (plasmid) [Ketogulonicigenium vulgare Y25]|nr:hypothetical protein EIO_3171 [Ketogulonicigenium vulgare Y25]